MLRIFIRNNKNLMAIILFLFLFGIVQILKPSFLYKNNDSIREFGVGYNNKTFLPLWLFSIILGIISYVFILYYASTPI